MADEFQVRYSKHGEWHPITLNDLRTRMESFGRDWPATYRALHDGEFVRGVTATYRLRDAAETRR